MASATSAAHTTTISASGSDPGMVIVYTTSTGFAPSTTSKLITPDSTRTSLLGPLTTTFTAPSRCTQAYWVSATDNIYDPTIGQTCTSDKGEIGYGQDYSCLPPAKPTISGSLDGASDVLFTTYDFHGYYSPGIVCPAGYSTACAAQVGTDGIASPVSSLQSFGFMYTATADETVVGCCPIGYHCTSIYSSQWCQHIIASTTQPVITCINGTNGALAASTTQLMMPTTVTLSGLDTQLSTEVTSTTPFTTLTILATMIQMNFQASDLASLSSTSSISTLLPSATSPLPPGNTSTSSSSSSSDNHKTTTIAISVVIPCIAALLIAGSLIWFRHRRKLKRQRQQQQQTSPTSYQAAPSTEPESMYSTYSYFGTGMSNSAPSEIMSSPARAEMEGSPVVYEMAGSTYPNDGARHEMDAGK